VDDELGELPVTASSLGASAVVEDRDAAVDRFRDADAFTGNGRRDRATQTTLDLADPDAGLPRDPVRNEQRSIVL